MAIMSKSACQVVSLLELLFCAFVFVLHTEGNRKETAIVSRFCFRTGSSSPKVIEERWQSFQVSVSEQAALHVMDVRRSSFMMDNCSLIWYLEEVLKWL